MMNSSGNNAGSMMLVVMVAVTLIALALIGSSQAAIIPPPHCNPEVADGFSPKLRRICAALYGMAEISNAVEQYLDEKSKRLLNTQGTHAYSWLNFLDNACALVIRFYGLIIKANIIRTTSTQELNIF